MGSCLVWQQTLGVSNHTLWKINMEPENLWFVEEAGLPKVNFRVACQFSRVYIYI